MRYLHQSIFAPLRAPSDGMGSAPPETAVATPDLTNQPDDPVGHEDGDFESNFGGLDLDSTDDIPTEEAQPLEVVEQPSTPPVPSVAPVAAPVVQPAPTQQAPAPVAQAPVAPAPAPVAAQVPAQAPVAEQQAPAQPAVPLTYEQQAAQLEASRNELLPLLAQQPQFIPDAALVEEFITDPAAALPKLAANLYLTVMTSVLRNQHALREQLMAEIPQQFEQRQVQQQAGQNYKQQFFAAWPELTEQDAPTILKTVEIYRHLNPEASTEDVIKNVGLISMQQLGRQVNQALRAQGGRVASPGFVQAARPVPFSPAVGGTVVAQQVLAPSAADEWAGFDMDTD